MEMNVGLRSCFAFFFLRWQIFRHIYMLMGVIFSREELLEQYSQVVRKAESTIQVEGLIGGRNIDPLSKGARRNI